MASQPDLLDQIADNCEELELLSERIGPDSDPEAIAAVLRQRAVLLHTVGLNLRRLGNRKPSGPGSEELSRRAQSGLMAALAHDARIAGIIRDGMADVRGKLDRIPDSSRAAISYAAHSTISRR